MQVAATAVARAARRRWRQLLGTGALIALVLALSNAAAPYLFRRATLQSEIATQVRVTTGFLLGTKGHARFDLLPSPRLRMADVHVSDPSGTVTIDAETLDGEVRLLPLLVGRLELASATLIKPKLAIDLDGRAMPPDSLIGRAMHARPGTAVAGDQRLGAVTLVDGTATLASRERRSFPSFSDINVTVDWRDLDSPATLTGAMRIASVAADVAAWIERPSALLRGDRSAAALRVHSIPLDLSASGDVAGAVPFGFRGHASGGASSLAALLALCGKPDVLPAPFADLAVNSDVALAYDRAGVMTLDLPNLHLSADGNSYEGTLAYQDAGTPLLSGTMAAERLSLQPFLARLPPLLGPGRTWSVAAMAPRIVPASMRLDMRISASHLRLPPFTLDEAALSVMTRGDRIEIGLNEGTAYGGAVKGRLSLGVANDGISLRGAGSLNGADAAAVGWDLAGRQLAAGSLSGSGSFETAGADFAALARNVKGWARGSAADGDLSGADFGLGLRALSRGRAEEAAAALRAGRTPFRTMSFDMRLDRGVATFGDATMQGRDADLAGGGSIDLGKRTLTLHAVAATPEPAVGTSRQRIPLEIGGTFDKPTVDVDMPAGTPAPASR